MTWQSDLVMCLHNNDEVDYVMVYLKDGSKRLFMEDE